MSPNQKSHSLREALEKVSSAHTELRGRIAALLRDAMGAEAPFEVESVEFGEGGRLVIRMRSAGELERRGHTPGAVEPALPNAAEAPSRAWDEDDFFPAMPSSSLGGAPLAWDEPAPAAAPEDKDEVEAAPMAAPRPETMPWVRQDDGVAVEPEESAERAVSEAVPGPALSAAGEDDDEHEVRVERVKEHGDGQDSGQRPELEEAESSEVSADPDASIARHAATPAIAETEGRTKSEGAGHETPQAPAVADDIALPEPTAWMEEESPAPSPLPEAVRAESDDADTEVRGEPASDERESEPASVGVPVKEADAPETEEADVPAKQALPSEASPQPSRSPKPPKGPSRAEILSRFPAPPEGPLKLSDMLAFAESPLALERRKLAENPYLAGSLDPKERARRLAETLAGEILGAKPAEVAIARQGGAEVVQIRLGADLEEARAEFARQIDAQQVDGAEEILRDALNRVLFDGEPVL